MGVKKEKQENRMKIDEAYPEAYRLAKRFHEFYEQSAPAFGYKTKEETKEFDPEYCKIAEARINKTYRLEKVEDFL